MAALKVTLIDVGWGDSVLIESVSGTDPTHYALVDSNDSQNMRSSYIFLKRHFEKADVDLKRGKPIFEFVMLSHAHADHAQGLKGLMRAFGTRWFWYPKSLNWSGCGTLLRFANRSSNVQNHQAVDAKNTLSPLGDVELSILWPERDNINASNENNNSVVLQLRLNKVSFLLTGDAEKEVWARIASEIPSDLAFFKVPHHGSANGTLDDNGDPVWLDDCPGDAVLGISSHVEPHEHPDEKVLKLFDQRSYEYYRTDRHYHVTFETDGEDTEVHFWH